MVPHVMATVRHVAGGQVSSTVYKMSVVSMQEIPVIPVSQTCAVVHR
jgi:hypothetical protein